MDTNGINAAEIPIPEEEGRQVRHIQDEVSPRVRRQQRAKGDLHV